MTQRLLQDEQIGDFYVRNDGGDSITDNNLASVVLTLSKINSGSNGNILEINNQGSGFDIVGTGNNFTLSKNGIIFAQSLTVANNITTEDLIVNGIFTLPSSIFITNLGVDTLNASGNVSFDQNLIVSNDLTVLGNFALSGNQTLNGTLITQDDVTINGDLSVTGTLTLNNVAFLNSNLDIQGVTTFNDSVIINTPNTDQLLIRSNNTSNVNLSLENNSSIGSQGFTTLKLQSNDNPLSYPSILFERDTLTYRQRVAQNLDEFEFVVNNAAGFTTRFVNETVGDHNVVIQGNVTVNKNITVLNNFSVGGTTSFTSISASNGIITDLIINKLEVAGALPENFIIETKDTLAGGFPSNPALRVVGTAPPFNLEYFNGIESLMLSERARFGIFDTVVPTEYPTPNAAFVAGKSRILLLPGDYDDTAFGTLNFNRDNVMIFALEKDQTTWLFTQLIWTGSRGLVSNFEIGSGAAAFSSSISMQGTKNRFSNIGFRNTTVSFDEEVDTIFEDIEVITLENSDMFTIASSSNLTFSNLTVSSFIVSGANTNSVFEFGLGNENIRVENAFSDLSASDITGNGYFTRISDIFENYTFDILNLSGFETLFNVASGITGGALNRLKIQHLLGNATSHFFNYESPTNDTAPLRKLEFRDVDVTISDTSTAIFQVITPSANPNKHKDWFFENTFTTSSTTGDGDEYHYKIETNTLENWKMNGISTLGGLFIKYWGNGRRFAFTNIVIEGNQNMDNGVARLIYATDFISRNGNLERISFSNISTLVRPQVFRLSAAGGYIKDVSYTNFTAESTTTSQGDVDGGDRNGNFHVTRDLPWAVTDFVWSGGSVKSSTPFGRNIFSTDTGINQGIITGVVGVSTRFNAFSWNELHTL